MLKHDYRDMGAGLLLALGGVWIAHYSASNYTLGTVRQMGPGMFPMGVGLIVAGLGAILFVQAIFRQGTMPEIRVWSPIFVLAGTAAFALTVRPFGLIPAVVVTTAISSIADRELRPVSLILLCLSLSLLSYLIFSVALGLRIPMFRWPF